MKSSHLQKLKCIGTKALMLERHFTRVNKVISISNEILEHHLG